MKSFLQNDNIEMYSTHNERKSVVAETFTRMLKKKKYVYITSISKNVYINKLDDIVHKYNNAYHRTIERKSDDVKPNTYINSTKEINDNDPNFNIGDIVRIWKYKNVFEKDDLPNRSKNAFVNEKVNSAVEICF